MLDTESGVNYDFTPLDVIMVNGSQLAKMKK